MIIIDARKIDNDKYKVLVREYNHDHILVVNQVEFEKLQEENNRLEDF